MQLTPKAVYSGVLRKGRVLNITVTSGVLLVEGYAENSLIVSANVSATTTYGPYLNDVMFKVASITGVADVSDSAYSNFVAPVISSDAPSDSDGRPNGTIYIQTA